MDRLPFKRQFLFLFCAIVAFSINAWSVRILIVTDQPSKQRAKEARALFEQTAPFSFMNDLSIVIKSIQTNEATCVRPYVDLQNAKDSPLLRGMPSSCRDLYSGKDQSPEAMKQRKAMERTIRCQSEKILNLAGETNADYMIFIKDSPDWFGTSGEILTLSSKVPPEIAVHEFMHALGFGDEYNFPSRCEADIHCPHLMNLAYVNTTAFADFPPYSSDQSAREQHSRQIPWYGQIKASTKIVTGTELGTPDKSRIGLFQVGICDKATEKIKSWKPGTEITVMEKANTAYIPRSYWPRIAEVLRTKIIETSSKMTSSKETFGAH